MRSAHHPRPRAAVTLTMEQRPLETTVEVGTEFLVRRLRRGRKGADHELATPREQGEAITTQVTEATEDTVTEDGAADGPADHEPHASGVPLGPVRPVEDQVDDDRGAGATAPGARDTAQVVTPSEAMLRRKHGREGTEPVGRGS